MMFQFASFKMHLNLFGVKQSAVSPCFPTIRAKAKHRADCPRPIIQLVWRLGINFTTGCFRYMKQYITANLL